MEQLRRLITSNRLTAGDPLPSVREVAGHHAINPMTVSRAYGVLESEGLLSRQRGKGMVVAPSRRRAQTDDRRLSHLEPKLADIARAARELWLADRLVLDRLRELLEQDAISVYLGNAFAPAPMASRLFNLRVLGIALWSAPLALAEMNIGRPVRWLAPIYLGMTAGLVWAWIMASLYRFIAGRSAAFAELALLPGLGNHAGQRRALYVAALARPLRLCALFSALALLWTWSASHALRPVASLGFVLIFLMLCAGVIIVGQLLVKRTVRMTKFTQFYLFAVSCYTAFRLINSAPFLAERFGSVFFPALALLAAAFLMMIWLSARRLAQCPHPFLDVFR